MLQLRPNCECCNCDLPAASPDARICSFECTFCSDCASTRLASLCPNCGGELVARPRRPAGELASHPASTERVFNAYGLPDAPAIVIELIAANAGSTSGSGLNGLKNTLQAPDQRPTTRKIEKS